MCSGSSDMKNLHGDAFAMTMTAVAVVLVITLFVSIDSNKVSQYEQMITDCEMAAQSPCEIVAVPSEDLR